MRSRLPKLPRRKQQTRPRWQRAAIKTARTTVELAAWFAIGFAALTIADATSTNGTWGAVLWLAIFCTVIGTCAHAMNNRTRIARAIRYSLPPKRHRKNPSSNSQTHNQSKRGLSRRFRRG